MDAEPFVEQLVDDGGGGLPAIRADRSTHHDEHAKFLIDHVGGAHTGYDVTATGLVPFRP